MSPKDPSWLIDLSEHQGPAVNFPQVKREGYEGVICKMTEGTGYIDPYGQRNLQGTITAGLWAGAYHFLWGGMSARKQATFFLQQVSKVTEPENVALFVDVEQSANMDRGSLPTFRTVRLFLQALEEKLPENRLGIYSGYYWRDNMGNPPISDLGLKQRPIIWDAHYFTSRIDYGSVLYRSVPSSYWEKAAFGGRKADILQFASTGRLQQFPNGIDVNAAPGGLESLTGASDVNGGDVSPDVWKPGRGDSLKPPAFHPEKPMPSSEIYQERHPTRYRWARHVQPLIRRLYREMGGPEEIHINTYLDHPEGFHRTLTSFDVWGPAGRNDPIGPEKGQRAFDIIWNEPGLPHIDWIIWQRTIRSRASDFEPKPWGENPFEFHDDHVHTTFVK